MTVLSLRRSPKEIIRLLKAEIKAAGGQPNFYASAHHDYMIEEDFDRAAYGLENDNRANLVTHEAVLYVEPHVEQNYSGTLNKCSQGAWTEDNRPRECVERRPAGAGRVSFHLHRARHVQSQRTVDGEHT